jgi:site-specific recombinase XerD
MTDRPYADHASPQATDQHPNLPAQSLRTIAPEPAAAAPDALATDLNRASEYARAEKATATRKAYTSDFAIFRAWAAAREASPMPAAPETIAAFLASQAASGVRASTLGRRVAAIRYAHKLAGHPLPTDDERVRATMRGVRRSLGTATTKKAPATADRLIAMAATGTGRLADLRDRAILLLGFAGAFRRSELVALDVADMAETKDGLLVTIRQSKTDQEGRGATVAVVRGRIACPVAALQEWLAAAAITEGPIFRPVTKSGKARPVRLTDRSVATIVKARAARLGFDPMSFGGHSLRAGFLTSAAARGASIFKMMDVSRHRSVDTLRGYVRDTELFRDHAGTGLL